MSKIRDLKDLVQEAIDDGATSAEEVHNRIAAMPFDQMEKIAAIEGLVQSARSLHDQSVQNVYDAIREVNRRAWKLADEALDKTGQ